MKLDATEEVVMKICSRHAKKRQLTYLMPGDNEGEWVCKESDQCKLSGPKNAAKMYDPQAYPCSLETIFAREA